MVKKEMINIQEKAVVLNSRKGYANQCGTPLPAKSLSKLILNVYKLFFPQWHGTESHI